MAVTFFNANATSGAASVGARTLLHTGTAGASLLVWIHSNEATTYSAVAAGLNPLTKITAVSAGTSRLELWALSQVPTGVLTISAIPAGTQVATWCMAAATYTGQRQIGGSPFGTVVAGSATTATLDISVSSTTTDIVAFGFGISANTTLTLNNGTFRASATHSTSGRLVIGDIAGATAVSISATAGAGTPVWGYAAVPIVASATAAETTIRFDNAAGTATTAAINTCGLLITATSNAVLIVFAHMGGGDSTISTMNVGALAMTRMGFDNSFRGGADMAEVWVLTAPPSGVLTISAVIADGVAGNFGLAAVTYTGHRTTDTPFGTIVQNSATAALSTTISVSSTAGNVVVVGFNSGMFNPISLSAYGVNIRHMSTGFPGVLVVDTPGQPAVTAGAFATSAVSWANFGINLIQSGPAAFISGNAVMTDAPDTFSASGYVLVRGSLNATDSPDTFSASGGTRIRGLLSATDAPDTFSASGGVRIRGLLSATDVPDVFSASGYTKVSGLLSATDAQDTLSASGYVLIQGSLNATDTPDTFSASGYVVGGLITGVFSATDAPDTLSASGYVLIQGALNATDAPDTFVASGTSIPLFITGRLSATDAPDVFIATGTSDPATGTTPAAVVTTLSSAGHGKKKNRNLKPPYIQAPSDFWEARERYLKSLQPELDEPEPQEEEVLAVPSDISPATVTPMLASYRLERKEIVTALPLAKSMRELRSYGERLRLINRQILDEKRAQLFAARQEVSNLQAIIAERRRKRAERIKRKRVLLATLEVARSLVNMYGKHPF